MAAWLVWCRSFESSFRDMNSSCASWMKPGGCGTPREPISSVIRVVLYPALSALITRSWYLVSFLSTAASNDVSKQTVSEFYSLALQHLTFGHQLLHFVTLSFIFLPCCSWLSLFPPRKAKCCYSMHWANDTFVIMDLCMYWVWELCYNTRFVSVPPHCSLTVVDPVFQTFVADDMWNHNFSPLPVSMCECCVLILLALPKWFVYQVCSQGQSQASWSPHSFAA